MLRDQDPPVFMASGWILRLLCGQGPFPFELLLPAFEAELLPGTQKSAVPAARPEQNPPSSFAQCMKMRIMRSYISR